ncbi:N-acetylglucosamine-6-phosphate deacetylase [Aquisalinus flavus]|uniref:N-acetylglucosamine-6-phosphate deacetylase n=1 Tax=Aquisalinus flavus TaxID=1526572 RepID=A0A8J2V5D5_9PROT|nr:N-acetylglucosamine-6-phosphate deacetylase [Aquisalinus flavus]MBD0427404.1 N-acetylglucosamine-6-phosphate deacetylase [Aquisalinus flavus]UNE47207.1 N-acetylglucosamine-6-phosphate deacetylase [Aquisalinus flavus]GGD00710.1 N-acetylglucosamine-6-phosphate deacetylase [Aquisalinus flavus]
MSRAALWNGTILADRQFLSGMAVLIEDGLITDIIAESDIPDDSDRHDLGGATVLPGFIDIQVNGGGGVLFNDAPTVETIRQIGAAHRQFGTTGFLPTLISDDLDVVAAALSATAHAMEEGVPGVLGIHLEGPFLSSDRKGIHDPDKFLTLQEQHLDVLTPLPQGVTMMTVAPEQIAPALIRRLTERGIVVSLGHSNADHAQTRAALDHGATGFTHLFNAMSSITAREPGVVGTALDDAESWCGLILDNIHVAPAVLRIAFRAKSLDKYILVTDAMPSVGMTDKSFALQGRQIRVENGVCVNEEGTLAGSDLSMDRAVRNGAAFDEVGLIDAVRMASANPAAFLGLDRQIGTIAPGKKASLVAVNDKLDILETWIDGVPSGSPSSGLYSLSTSQ